MSGGVAVHEYPIKAGASAALAHDSTNPADASVLGKAVDVGLCTTGSFQVTWAGLTGTIDATAQLFCSDNGTNWDEKSDANGDPVLITLAGAADTEVISLNGVLSETFYKVVYTPNGVTGGTVEAIVWGKPS